MACCFGIASQFLFGGKIIQRQQKGICKDVKLTINDDTIILDNGSTQAVYKWSSVKDVYNKKHNIIVFVADVQAITIPKRIFNSGEEIDNCWKYLLDCYNNTHGV